MAAREKKLNAIVEEHDLFQGGGLLVVVVWNMEPFSSLSVESPRTSWPNCFSQSARLQEGELSEGEGNHFSLSMSMSFVRRLRGQGYRLNRDRKEDLSVRLISNFELLSA